MSGSGTFSGGIPHTPVAPHPEPAARLLPVCGSAHSRPAVRLCTRVPCPVTSGFSHRAGRAPGPSGPVQARPRGSARRPRTPFCRRRVRAVDTGMWARFTPLQRLRTEGCLSCLWPWGASASPVCPVKHVSSVLAGSSAQDSSERRGEGAGQWCSGWPSRSWAERAGVGRLEGRGCRGRRDTDAPCLPGQATMGHVLPSADWQAVS